MPMFETMPLAYQYELTSPNCSVPPTTWSIYPTTSTFNGTHTVVYNNAFAYTVDSGAYSKYTNIGQIKPWGATTGGNTITYYEGNWTDNPYIQSALSQATGGYTLKYDWAGNKYGWTTGDAYTCYGYGPTSPPAITWTTGSSATYNYFYIHNSAEMRRQQLRLAIRNRLRQPVPSSREPMGSPEDIREQRARETLRRLIGEAKYRLFLTSGFVSVKSPRSGKVYQIFPGHKITRVYQRGQLIERLCVVLTGQFPPTDSVIVRYLMILNNEEDFRRRAVQHGLKGLQEPEVEEIDMRPLIEIARDTRRVG